MPYVISDPFRTYLPRYSRIVHVAVFRGQIVLSKVLSLGSLCALIYAKCLPNIHDDCQIPNSYSMLHVIMPLHHPDVGP